MCKLNTHEYLPVPDSGIGSFPWAVEDMGDGVTEACNGVYPVSSTRLCRFTVTQARWLDDLQKQLSVTLSLIGEPFLIVRDNLSLNRKRWANFLRSLNLSNLTAPKHLIGKKGLGRFMFETGTESHGRVAQYMPCRLHKRRARYQPLHQLQAMMRKQRGI